MILVSEADIFFTESLRILAERLSQSENGLPLRLICNNSPPEEVGVFSTEIKSGSYERQIVGFGFLNSKQIFSTEMKRYSAAAVRESREASRLPSSASMKDSSNTGSQV